MSNAVAIQTDRVTQIINVAPYAYWPMNERVAYAKILAGAKDLLPAGLRAGTMDETAAKVFLVLETGAMLGLHPMAAFQGIDVIEGNATISPETFTGLVRGAGHKLRIRESGTIAAGDFMVTVTLIRSDDPEEPIVKTWALEDAVQAGLCELVADQNGRFTVKARSKNGNALNWEKYPKDMCQWRALGRLARAGAADVTMGVGYFPEELEVLVNQDGVREDMTAFEDAIIEQIRTVDDRADMRKLWRSYNRMEDGKIVRGDAWSKRVEAEFDAHLSTITKDSDPPKDGAPGQTGLAAIDGATESGPTATEPRPEPSNTPESAREPAEGVSQAVSEAPGVEEVVDGEVVDEHGETEEERYERISREEADAFLAAQEAESRKFDPTALDK